MNRSDVQQALERRLQMDGSKFVAFPSYDKVLTRLSSERLSFYVGIDATGSHIHIGHSIPLLLLKDLISFGHDVIILIGDFTSRIGDPTDKQAARVALSEKEVAENMKTYVKQIAKLLPKGSFQIRYNSSWLKKMNLEKILELTGHMTVQQMMARDMFQKRKSEERPIFLSEFLYPLMQGYDSVAMDIDGEVGGNDQTFNMLVGRDLLKIYSGKDKVVLPTRLLIDVSSGKKISKTEGGFIALDDAPEVIFEKVSRSIPNEMLRTVFELCTEVSLKEIEERQQRAERDGNWHSYNLELAEELVRMYHGEGEVERARSLYGQAAKGEVEDDEAVRINADEQSSVAGVLSDALKISKSEAKRLVQQRAVTRNGKLVEDALRPAGLKNGDVLRVGSHRPFRIMLKN